jgi:diguanylate cyclase (GGDEF)-like protein
MKDRGLLVRSRPIRGTPWRSYAGVERASTLSPTRSSLTRGAVLGGLALLALLAAFAVVSRRIGRPLRQLTDAVGATGPHADEALLAIRGPREIRTLADEFRTVLAAHTGYEEQLVHQALHDPLTGLANRALLGERLALSLEQANRNGRSVAVLLLGLDRFKFVNDSLGHAAGDEVLIQLAARLRAFVRAGDTLARFGGDEFVMVAEGVETPEDAARIGASLLAEVETPIQAADTVVRLSASVGMTLSTPRSRADELIRDADNARHRAKDLGSARCELFDDELRHRATTRLRLESELRVALERGELRLVYQPKVELLGGEIRGVEALLRWAHPGLGPVPPSTFIPIAEETGMIVEIGRFVLEEASRLAAGWQRDGRDLSMAVNVSGRQLADGDFGADVAAVLATTGLHPGRLVLELTETLLMTEAVRTTPTLRGLHDRGVRISIDDFGTGYSSLAYLHRFPVDELKIDRVFVHDLLDHAGQRALVGGMIAMGKALDLEIVAEGVETEAQAHELRLLGCDAAQGYLFAAPQTPEDLQRLLAEQPRRARMRPLS